MEKRYKINEYTLINNGYNNKVFYKKNLLIEFTDTFENAKNNLSKGKINNYFSYEIIKNIITHLEKNRIECLYFMSFKHDKIFLKLINNGKIIQFLKFNNDNDIKKLLKNKIINCIDTSI